MRKIVFFVVIAVVAGIGTWFIARGFLGFEESVADTKEEKQEDEIEKLLSERRDSLTGETPRELFDENGISRVLLIGLDKRVGQTQGHCDVIQLVTLDSQKQMVTITAVPRGTYSPLPPGTGTTSSDYYVSNACGLGGLDYGVKQIEKILGQHAEHLVVVGFSETLGILRTLGLPTTESLEWLRHRQGYAIGEPQRARNHSTFLKQMMVRFATPDESKVNTALEYIIYKMIQTDLSFAEVQKLVDTLSSMDLGNHPERVQLLMRPAYTVQDIPYDPEHLNEYLHKMIDPLKSRLSQTSYSGEDKDAMQKRLLDLITEKKDDTEFLSWAYENDLWLQIEDEQKRNEWQYTLTTNYLSSVSSTPEREQILTDYILEMQYRGNTEWEDKGKQLLTQEKSL